MEAGKSAIERAFELIWIVAPTAAVLVLCLRREVVIFPVASALLLSTALSWHAGLAPSAGEEAVGSTASGREKTNVERTRRTQRE